MNKEIIKLDITGMTCDHCATGIEKLLSKNEGVKEANVSYPKATCECSFDPTKTSKEEIINTINGTKNYRVKSEISENGNSRNNQFDLIIIGGGSAAFSAAIKAESLGLTGLEAMACGTPVIACNIAGPSTYIQSHKNGFLFEPKNSEALTDYIIQYQRLQPEQKDKFKLEALNTSKNFRKDIVAQNLLKRLKALLD